MRSLKFTYRYTKMDGDYYPMIPIRIGWKGRFTRTLDGLLDTGADNIIIPKGTALYLGLDLKESEKPMSTAGGEAKCYTANANIIVGGGGREVKYENVKIFVADHDKMFHLIGKDPVLNDYDVLFMGKEHKIIMTPAIEKAKKKK